VTLITDNMGLGKTQCMLATLLYLKYIINLPGAGRSLPCVDGKLVMQLEQIPQIFGTNNEKYRRPAFIIIPANLTPVWERAVQSLIQGTGLTLTNLYSSRRLTHNKLNYSSDNPELSRAIHLISYSPY